MSVNIKVTGGLNIEWGQIDPKVTGGLIGGQETMRNNPRPKVHKTTWREMCPYVSEFIHVSHLVSFRKLVWSCRCTE